MTLPVREAVLDDMLTRHVTQTRVNNAVNTPLSLALTAAQVRAILKTFLNYDPFRTELRDRQGIERQVKTMLQNLQQLQGAANPDLLLSDEETALATALSELAVFDGI